MHERCAVGLKEDEIVPDGASLHQSLAQGQMALQYLKCTSAQLNLSILVGLCPIFSAPTHARALHADLATRNITIADLQCELLGGP